MINASDLVAKFQYALDNKWGYIWGTAGIKWTQAAQNAATRETTVKYGQRWVGSYVADCSGLFSWAFKQLGGYMYHGSNTMYREYCTNKGKLSGQTLKPGTAVFTGTEDNHGHVGLYIGNGKVIEAKGTQYGVVMSNLSEKKWTYWGELKGVNYSGEPTPPGKPTLRKGDSGEYVTLMQTELIQHGYSCGDSGADGKFGSNTEKALKRFQQDNVDQDGKPLTVDGVCGEKTWWALDQAEITLYTVTIPHLPKYHADALVANYSGAYMTEERG